jgi:hypothetical protein
MSSGVIADNWSLQEISSLLIEGLSDDQSDEISIHENKHHYVPITSAIIQTEALFDFLTDIILRDEIIIDSKFTNTWEHYDSPLMEIKKNGIIRDFPFLAEEEKLTIPRDKMIEKLCVTNSLLVDHKENVIGWEKSKATPHHLLSSTLWGGAGMLARSYVYEKNYTPHPLRKRLFVNTGILLDNSDALTNVKNIIDEKRLHVSRKILGNNSLYSIFLNLPPLPIKVIQESNSASDLIKVAVEMRSEFLNLRNWIKTFQQAITDDDIKKMHEHYKLFESVTNNIDSKFGEIKKGKFSFSAGIGIFKFAYNGNLINDISNKFGIRATINRLIMESTGKKELERYCKMFGEKNSEIEFALKEHYKVN